MSTNDHEFVIKTVVEFYTEEEINVAKKLLFETCPETALRLKAYRIDAAKLNCRDMINKMNEAGVHCPSFVALNIAKLPIVTADAFNIAKLSKDVVSVLNIEQNVATSSATLDSLQNNLASVLEKCSKIDAIADELEKLKSAVERRNGRRVIESDSSASESNPPNSTTEDATDEDIDNDTDENTDVDTDDDTDDNTDDNTDNDVFSVEASHVNHCQGEARISVVPDPPVLRLNDRPPHLKAWMTEGGFQMVVTSADKKKRIESRTFVNTSRKNIGTSRDALKTIIPQHHGNDRRHGEYSRRNNKMCEVFISRLVPETTVRDVNNFLMPRLNRTVKIEQMRTKYDEYSSFKLCVPTYLKNKVLDKNFWGNNDIYVRNFVQKTRY